MTSSQSTEQLKSKQEKKKLTPKQIGGGILTALALTSVLGSGCSAKTPEAEPRVTTEVQASSDETSIELKTEAYSDAMEKYNNMSIDEFDALPREERMMYAQYKVDQTNESGLYDVYYYEGVKNMVEPIELSAESSSKEIVQNDLRLNQIAFIQELESSTTDNPLDTLNGQKILSIAYYVVGENEGNNIVLNRYAEFKDLLESEDLSSQVTFNYAATDESPIEVGVDSVGGDTVRYKDITLESDDGKIVYCRFVNVSFLSYDGTKKEAWPIESISDSPEERMADSIIKK